MRAERTPKDRSREKGVDTGTSKLVTLVWRTHVWNFIDLEVQDTDADECRDECGDHLREEGVSGRNLDVVCELHIVGETDGVSACHIAVALEVVHGEGVASDPGAADEFGENIECHFNSRHGCDEADWDDEDQAKCDTVEDYSDGSVCLPASDTGT